MKKINFIPIFVLLVLVSGCAGPRYDQTPKTPDWILSKEKWQIIELNGYKANYTITGKGTAIIFLPGISGLRPKLSPYPKLCTSYKCIAYNLRGLIGDENKIPDYGIQLLADDLNELFKKLKLKKAILVGSSYGGTVALQFTLDHPEKVKALILKGSFAKFDLSLKQNFLAWGIKYAPSIFYQFFVEKHVEEVVAKGEPQWAYDYLLESDLAAPRETAIQRVESLRKFDLRKKLLEIKVPTLIIIGRQDKLAGLKYQLQLASHISNSYIKVIDGVGHLVDILKPKEYEAAILNVLKMIERMQI